ncbi:MAG: TolC family protein [Candidatus Kapabacteria bacterium]|nr:TolC family protein [Ignavibacteriota bacterium]MCW5883349.1 TolC family protein [Candidatus Kapabacteria bacterium]
MIQNIFDKFKIIILVISVLILNNFDAESQVKILTLDDAIKTALQNNSDTRIALLEVKKAQSAVNEAFGYALPSVDFSASYTHLLEKPRMPFPDFEALLNNSTYSVLEAENLIPKDPNHFLPMRNVLQAFALSNNYEAKLEVTQILFNSAVFTGIGASGKYLQTSQEMLNSKVSKTVLQVKQAFYGIVLAKEVVDLMNVSLDNFQKHYKNVKAMYDQGIAAEYNVLQAEVQVENFKPSLLEAENALKNSKEGLKLILKLDKDTEIDVDGSLVYNEIAVAQANDLIKIANERNNDIRTLESKIEVDEAFIDLDRSDWWPSLAAFGNYSLNGMADDFNFLNYRQSMVGVALQMNLFNGNRTKNKVQQATIERIKTEEQLSQLRDFVTLQIKTKLNELDRVKQNLISADRNVELAEKTAKIASIGYTNGTRTQLEVLTAETQLRQAKTNRLQSVYAYIVTLNEIDDLIGNIKDDYIQMVMRNEINK